MAKREKKAATRNAILDAAAVVVGRHGYGKASIGRIAEEAGVAHGLIYLYFQNQQDLFDQLLPHVGEAMLRFIADATMDAKTLAERERKGLDANFEYLQHNPALHRILNEAAFFAPKAHQQYLRRMAGGYTRSLQRGWDANEISGFDESELEVIAYMMIGAREYLLERYAVSGHEITDLPPDVKKTYLRMVARSLGLDSSMMLPAAKESASTS
ncbi:TetR/AcrR family transcriptional regulator [Aquicoccus sp.]|uniref:TetR/AcrR family transcriptional regulator n=1 Tax=Aquicoccus sp. TaxID=2055851 RepID=UPI003568F86C